MDGTHRRDAGRSRRARAAAAPCSLPTTTQIDQQRCQLAIHTQLTRYCELCRLEHRMAHSIAMRYESKL